MSIKGIRFSFKSFRVLAPFGVGLMILAMVGGPAMMAGAAPQDQTPETPLVQQFEDVPDSHTFAQFINALYLDNIISGYPCTCANGEYSIAEGLEITEFSRERIDASVAELREEREAVAGLGLL